MEIIAGLIAAATVVGLGVATGQGRSLPFYGTVLVVIALAYVLFAVMAETPRTIVIESAIAVGFIGVTVGGIRWSSLRGAGWLVAGGLVAHGAYDLVHGTVVPNAVVPDWWPMFCLVVDLLLGGWVFLLGRRDNLKIHHEE